MRLNFQQGFNLKMLLPLITLALASTCPPEGVAQMKRCYTDYFQNFNLTLFPEFEVYNAILSGQLSDGKLTALESQCQSANKLTDCLGDYADACVDVTVLSKNFGVSFKDTYSYVGYYAIQGYYCNEGYDCKFSFIKIIY